VSYRFTLEIFPEPWAEAGINQSLEITFDYTPSTPDTYSRDWGWMPGDPDEVNFREIALLGGTHRWADWTDLVHGQLYDLLWEQCLAFGNEQSQKADRDYDPPDHDDPY
jgi:hypothetical protein